MIEPLPPETLDWLHSAAESSVGKLVLRHVMQRLDALEATDQLDAEAWSSMRRASCDYQRRLLILEGAQQQPADPGPAATEIVTTPEAAPVATDEEIRKVYDDAYDNGLDPRFLSALRAVYEFGRQHGAAQPPAPKPASESAPVAAPAGGLLPQLRSAVRPLALMGDEWQAVISEVAAWLDFEGYVRAADDLRKEVVE